MAMLPRCYAGDAMTDPEDTLEAALGRYHVQATMNGAVLEDASVMPAASDQLILKGRLAADAPPLRDGTRVWIVVRRKRQAAQTEAVVWGYDPASQHGHIVDLMIGSEEAQRVRD